MAAQGTRDYDRDGDGLIEIRTLAQLNAIRWDLDGNGTPNSNAADYGEAFPNALTGMGCATTCTGYELRASLDFDENGDGTMSPRDSTYWNEGAGWLPIGQDPGYARDTGSYNAIFEGNGNTISNLYINRHITNNVRYTGVGLFGISGGQLRNVGLENPYISVTRSGTSGYRTRFFTGPNFTDVGALIGSLSGRGATISGSWVNGGGMAFTQGEGERSDVTVGCLAGVILPATFQTTENPANYATCAVYAHSTLSRTWAQANAGNRDRNIARVGGLAGSFNWGHASASYARGNVTCRGNGEKACGGLFGRSSRGNVVSSYATGNVVNEAFSPPRISGGQCENTYEGMLSGGLTGRHRNGNIIESYSTGRVTAAMATPEPCTDGRWAARLVGGLGIRTDSGSIANSYWDAESSGIAYNDGGGAGHTTARLTNPTGYADIYANWNRDLDGGGSDDPWDFGTGAQYPILTWRHDALSQRRQRANDPVCLPYVAPPIVYNLNIRFSVKGLTLDEGESATYQVRMSQPPRRPPGPGSHHQQQPGCSGLSHRSDFQFRQL